MHSIKPSHAAHVCRQAGAGREAPGIGAPAVAAGSTESTYKCLPMSKSIH